MIITKLLLLSNCIKDAKRSSWSSLVDQVVFLFSPLCHQWKREESIADRRICPERSSVGRMLYFV
eukprot:m.33643 g.33643  ORF g.33643 m.33643 type:complete len:65 (+) comp6462_c0_seq1:486-680(+)